jgi:hypothetical protein
MVQKVGDNWWQICVFNILCAVNWNKNEMIGCKNARCRKLQNNLLPAFTCIWLLWIFSEKRPRWAQKCLHVKSSCKMSTQTRYLSRKLSTTMIHSVMKIRTVWPSVANLASLCIPNCNEGQWKMPLNYVGGGAAWWCYVLPHCYQIDHHHYHQRKCMLLHIREYTYVLHRRRSHEEFSYLDQRYVIILTQ